MELGGLVPAGLEGVQQCDVFSLLFEKLFTSINLTVSSINKFSFSQHKPSY
jgi:hypothetical protein